jgi:hypothetical protein
MNTIVVQVLLLLSLNNLKISDAISSSQQLTTAYINNNAISNSLKD